MKLTGLYFGSYWMGKNDVVYLMAKELERVVKLKIIDTKIYSKARSPWYSETLTEGARFKVRWIDHNKLVELVKLYNPNFIVINSGGMSITEESSEWLKIKGIVSVGIELSDPDVYTDNGRVYSKFFDLFYTNSKLSLDSQYSNQSNVKWLPFAAFPRLHKPMSKVKKIHDIVIIGHARKDRLELVNKLRLHYDVATFGTGWGDGSKEVHGTEHARAINSGKIYLSFAMTYDGHTNIKVGLLEAAACKTCIITSRFKELEHLYTYGLDIVGYDSEESLLDSIDYYLHNEVAREWLADNCYYRTINHNLWSHRWKDVLDDINDEIK